MTGNSGKERAALGSSGAKGWQEWGFASGEDFREGVVLGTDGAEWRRALESPLDALAHEEAVVEPLVVRHHPLAPMSDLLGSARAVPEAGAARSGANNSYDRGGSKPFPPGMTRSPR